MSKIEKINLNKTIDYLDDEIYYFINEESESLLKNHEEIAYKIFNAKKSIKIVSTSNICDEIIDEIYKSDVNIYMILKSFDGTEKTHERFDERKPAVIREVEEIENNFIIIDDISYLFINPLSETKNISIELDEDKTKDMRFIFDYYFWNCAKREKLLNEIADAIDSPFPPFSQRDLPYINIVETDLDDCKNLYIPRDKNYSPILDKESNRKYFSEDIQSVIQQTQAQLHVGSLVLDDIDFTITNRWIYTKDVLDNINTDDEIIPLHEDWKSSIKIQECKEIKLTSIESKTIEDMNNTFPKEFPKESYVKEMTFCWEVLVPSKPNDAKKSTLYSEFDTLNNEFQRQLKILNSELLDLEKESGRLSSWFGGANRKAKENIKQIEVYTKKDLKEFNSIDLNDFIHKEFKDFYQSIIKSNSDFKEEKKEKEAKEKWEAEKSQKLKSLESQEKQLKEDNNKFSSINDKTKERTKLEKSIKKLEDSTSALKRELEDEYKSFNYKPKQNEIKNFNKNKTNSNEYKSLNIPKYVLPEVGVLHETSSSYFLEILDDKDLSKANELRERYTDKDYKVVVGKLDE